jgi:hypothetical protein
MLPSQRRGRNRLGEDHTGRAVDDKSAVLLTAPSLLFAQVTIGTEVPGDGVHRSGVTIWYAPSARSSSTDRMGGYHALDPCSDSAIHRA